MVSKLNLSPNNLTMKQFNNVVSVSAPAKLQLLGEHSVVYGKPALLAAVDLRMTVTISHLRGELKQTPSSHLGGVAIRKIIEPIVKKELKIKKIPPYRLEISSQIPIGGGLGSSAAISASSIAALLSFLKVKWDLNLIYKLAYEAEKVFHVNPSGAETATVIYGGLIWYRKESEDLKLIHPLNFPLPPKLAKNFILLNTGTPKQTTRDMVLKVKHLYQKRPKVVGDFLEGQERLVRELLPAIKNANEKEVIRIIREGERNLESIGVCSPEVKKIIREIESSGGAAKICGAGASSGPTGVLLCYHPQPSVVQKIAKSYNLDYFKIALGVEGLRNETI